MKYQALYRKYRPQRFDEVVGQDHVTTTLAREVVQGQVAHAYLLAGPRGTGKTTTARLLAKSLNCADRGPEGEPDNTCPSCVAITEGTSLDVIELDAASNNKVEDVREIRTNASTVTATAGSHRVYILDEAHMLTRAAGNALLKVLEEPPEHVIFVLATTEPYKLLDTIRSRSQRFDFHPVATETLIDYLETIADREGFSADRGALEAVTSHAGGSVRDAMSLLEQVAALGAGTVTSAGVSQALGLADHAVYAQLVNVIAAGDAAAGLQIVAELASSGADLRRFVGDAIGHFRGLFLAQYASNIEEVVDASAETIAEWKQQATMLSSTDVLRSIDELASALVQLREGREERLVVEIAIIHLTRPETVPDLDGVRARLDRIERQIADGAASQPKRAVETGPPDRPFKSTEDEAQKPEVRSQKSEVTPEQEAGSEQRKAESVPQTPSAETDDQKPEASSRQSEEAESGERKAESSPKREEPEPPASPSTAPLTIETFRQVWPAVMADIRHEVGPRRQAFLREATPAAVDGNTVIFEVAAHLHFHLEHLKSDEAVATAIGNAAAEKLDTPIAVTFRSADAQEVIDVEPERAPDKDDLVSATDEDAVDPVDVVVDVLGGQVVDE